VCPHPLATTPPIVAARPREEQQPQQTPADCRGEYGKFLIDAETSDGNDSASTGNMNRQYANCIATTVVQARKMINPQRRHSFLPAR
jgi:hypothetical protein